MAQHSLCPVAKFPSQLRRMGIPLSIYQEHDTLHQVELPHQRGRVPLEGQVPLVAARLLRWGRPPVRRERPPEAVRLLRWRRPSRKMAGGILDCKIKMVRVHGRYRVGHEVGADLGRLPVGIVQIVQYTISMRSAAAAVAKNVL